MDSLLIRSVELRATGADIHNVKQVLQVYIGLHNLKERSLHACPSLSDCGPNPPCQDNPDYAIQHIETALRMYLAGIPLRRAIKEATCSRCCVLA